MRTGNPAAPSFMDRITALEKRIEALEMGAATGLSNTDQTIKGSHDRLDSLLGAGVSAPDGSLVSNLNADLLDGEEGSAFYGINVQLAESGVSETFTDETAFVNITNTATNVTVESGDVVVALLLLIWSNDAVSSAAANLRLDIDGDDSTSIFPGTANANNREAVTLIYARTASGSNTWTVQGKVKVVGASDTITIRQQKLVVIRFRPGG